MRAIFLESCYQHEVPEAGCDEAGRGCLAGPVFAASVVLPPGFVHPLLNDSKRMTERNRAVAALGLVPGLLLIAQEYPQYGWARNKGYPTRDHRLALLRYGATPYHRLTFGRTPRIEK